MQSKTFSQEIKIQEKPNEIENSQIISQNIDYSQLSQQSDQNDSLFNQNFDSNKMDKIGCSDLEQTQPKNMNQVFASNLEQFYFQPEYIPLQQLQYQSDQSQINSEYQPDLVNRNKFDDIDYHIQQDQFFSQNLFGGSYYNTSSNQSANKQLPQQIKQQSIVQRYFSQTKQSFSQKYQYNKSEQVICMICGFISKNKKINSDLSQLLKHLKDYHPKALLQYNQHKQESQIHSQSFVNQNQIQSQFHANWSSYYGMKYKNYGISGETSINKRCKPYKKRGRPARQQPQWQVFKVDDLEEWVTCLICGYNKKKQKKSSRYILKHLQNNHPEVDWLIKKQIGQGLYQQKNKFKEFNKQSIENVSYSKKPTEFY